MEELSAYTQPPFGDVYRLISRFICGSSSTGCDVDLYIDFFFFLSFFEEIVRKLSRVAGNPSFHLSDVFMQKIILDIVPRFEKRSKQELGNNLNYTEDQKRAIQGVLPCLRSRLFSETD